MQNQRDTSKPSRLNSSRSLVWVILIGIGVCVVVLALWWIMFPSEPSAVVSQSEQTASQKAESKPQEETLSPPVPAQAVTGAKMPSTDNAGSSVVQPVQVAASSPKVSPVTAVGLSEVKKIQAQQKAVQFIDHEVEEGEDLISIASSYGLKTQTLIAVNQIRNVAAITTGTVLRIPDRDGQLYTVREGDILSRIASKNNLGWKTLMELNGLTSDRINIGQTLFIPDPMTTSATALADVSPISFVRPATGTIVGMYGQASNDPAEPHGLEGILIQGKEGSAVVASASGNVVDAGNEQKGRGRFVVISHENGYRTMYAHLENVEVKIGDGVSKGQSIGSIGTTGTEFTVPTLLFVIQQNGINLNPADFF
ncbi:MAG: LysM peptidoglycan-binding domain-containing protein [Sphaerochaetaceae bacterium]